jgi:hypothetical protein
MLWDESSWNHQCSSKIRRDVIYVVLSVMGECMQDGRTALIYATMNCNADIMSRLLEFPGIAINAADKVCQQSMSMMRLFHLESALIMLVQLVSAENVHLATSYSVT